MKYCPNCQTTYTDNTLRFCLHDGTPLAEVSDTQTNMPTIAFDELETVVTPKQPQQVVRINLPETEPQNRESAEQPTFHTTPQVVAEPAEIRQSNTALTVLATILGMILLFGIGGAWFLLKSRKTEVASANASNTPVNRPAILNSANIQNLNVNVSNPTPSPTATPLPKPTIKAEETKTIKNDVKDAIDVWIDSSENLDLDGNLEQYADTVDYYIAGRVNRARVRADKQRAFDQYDLIKFKISNMQVTPDASGDKATAVFDKEWNFEGENKFSSGKVQQQLTFEKVEGRWLITGEKDLKTYYVEK